VREEQIGTIRHSACFGHSEATFLLKQIQGSPEVSEDLVGVSGVDLLGAHGGQQALVAVEERVVKFHLPVFVLAVLDQGQDAVEAAADEGDLLQWLERGHATKFGGLETRVVPGVETVPEGVFVVGRRAALTGGEGGRHVAGVGGRFQEGCMKSRMARTRRIGRRTGCAAE